MDISSATLIALSGSIVLASSIVIICVNYKNICKCCIKKPEINDNSVNPVNPINSVKIWA